MRIEDFVPLVEAAEDDLRRSDLAQDLSNALVSRLNAMQKAERTIKDLQQVQLNDQIFYAIFGSDLDLPAIIRPILVAFRHADFPGNNGSAAMVDNPTPYLKYVIKMEADTTSLKSLMHSIMSASGKLVLHHEVQHILDYTRFKDKKGISDRTIVKLKKQSSAGLPPEEAAAFNDKKYQAYHNDTLELNAYFHNMAEPLLSRLRLMKRQGFGMHGLLSPIPRDFREYLRDTITGRTHGIVAQHWAAISEKNKRRAIARLKQLFDMFWEWVDEHEKATPQQDDSRLAA